MIIWHWEKFTFPRHDPSLTVDPLTLRTMPIAARVVADRLFATITTAAHMSAQSDSSTKAECSQGFPCLHNRLELSLELFAMKMDNLCYLMYWLQDLSM